MKEVIEMELRDDVKVWGMGDVTHRPILNKISLPKEKGWFIGQKVRVTIESIS